MCHSVARIYLVSGTYRQVDRRKQTQQQCWFVVKRTPPSFQDQYKQKGSTLYTVRFDYFSKIIVCNCNIELEVRIVFLFVSSNMHEVTSC